MAYLGANMNLQSAAARCLSCNSPSHYLSRLTLWVLSGITQLWFEDTRLSKNIDYVMQTPLNPLHDVDWRCRKSINFIMNIPLGLARAPFGQNRQKQHHSGTYYLHLLLSKALNFNILLWNKLWSIHLINPSLQVCPIIDIISDDTLAYQKSR